MKKDKRYFILIELILAGMVLVLSFVMLQGKYGNRQDRVSVIVQDSEDGQWAAFRYGLKKAAEDQNIELFLVTTEGSLTAEEQKQLIEEEAYRGADAVIVQPACGEEAERMLKKVRKQLPVMLVESVPAEAERVSALPVTSADHYAMGAELAKELLSDYGGKLEGKTLGILMKDEDTESAGLCRDGVWDALADSGIRLEWVISGGPDQEREEQLTGQKKVDFVIALDDRGLRTAGELSERNDLHGAIVYGIGRSTESVHYLDMGYVECLVVPDDFDLGYQSLTELAAGIRHSAYIGKDQPVSHRVLRRKTLFTEENQDLLFTMCQ